MKRLILVIAFVWLLSISAAAKSLENTEITYEISGVHTAYLNNDPKTQAEMLKKLGLFIGTGKGFELERTMTRCEAAVMVVRFLGMEQTVQSGIFTHPFTDVPQWADPYVGWLYQNGVTKGVSDTLYGSAQEVTYWQYATLLSRAIANSDDFLTSGVGRADEQRREDGSEKILLGNSPEHGLSIAGFTAVTADTVDFFTASDQGMQHFDIYRYRLMPDGSILVTDFEAGRPEMMEGFSLDDPSAYKKVYIEKEQTRLDALGY